MDLNNPSRINSACLMILAATAITGALVYTRPILVPFTISVFIYLALLPAQLFLQRVLKITHPYAVTIIAVFYLLLSSLLLLLFVHSFDSILDQVGVYRLRLLDLTEQITAILPEWMALDGETLRKEVDKLPILEVMQGITGNIFSLFGNVALIAVFTLFLLAGKPKQIQTGVFGEFREKVSRYIVAKIFVSSLTATVTAIVFFIIDADLILMFAMLTFLLNFIPNVGSIIAVAVPLPILYLQFGFNSPLWIFLISCSLAQFIIGNILEPKLLGDSLDLHPVAVLFFLMFWGLVWGIPGMFLAVPITSLLKILFERLEPTRPLAELLAGRF